jgi:nucleotide-binding universal stress UspA family protein
MTSYYRSRPDDVDHPPDAATRSEAPPWAAQRAPIVVGVDELDRAADAIEWAAAEAASCDRPLRLVHAWTFPAAFDPFGLAPAPDCRFYRATADDILRDAERQARLVAPEVRITTATVPGTALDVLQHVSKYAHQLVLGAADRRKWLPGRPLAGELARLAICPVTVVRPFSTVPAGPSVARVVVGVGDQAIYEQSRDPDRIDRAVRYAFRAAERRGIGLTAVRGCAIRPNGHTDLSDEDRAILRAELRLLRAVLRNPQRRFPTVTVEPKVLLGKAAVVLTAESAGAALTVVGSHRSRCSFPAARLSDRLPGRVHSPLTIVGQHPTQV